MRQKEEEIAYSCSVSGLIKTGKLVAEAGSRNDVQVIHVYAR